MADEGVIQKHSSVFRKRDKIWVPVTLPLSSLEFLNMRKMQLCFIGYTRGKLHELVMKSYKSREFAAAINEVLDPWINARQREDIESTFTIQVSVFCLILCARSLPTSKRARINGIEEECEMDEDVLTFQDDECEFDDLCADVTFRKGDAVDSEVKRGSWDLLDGHVLARVFHFLRADIKSLFFAALTCRHWRSVVKFYKDISRQNGYKKEKITSLLLRGCTSITSGMLEELLQSFPFLSSIDVRGCPQLEELVCKFPNINWLKNRVPHKRDSANQLFRRSLYKRSKLFDARKSSSILSRDAQLRRLAIKKTGNGYKRMEGYIVTCLRNIMNENTFEFFESKVGEIEERMRNGYYSIRGLNSIKEDISRMCRDAIKIKNRGDARDMNRIVTLFIQLATSLDKGPKLAYARDEMMKSWKDGSPPGFSSSSKYKKSFGKVSERKQSYRSNGLPFVNGHFDSVDYASDREIRRRLSKLNKKFLHSGSDTSDDFDKSSDGSTADSTSTASETESELEYTSEGALGESRGGTYFTPDDGFDSLADEREWGARMTKASLVPPVTRKYDVIDHYVIVADEEEVRRKMRVSLPEDYAEKLNAQRNGTEESDMEIPEVKDYKPRKTLGDEVIEQEVYGIDPYTHNLLLDSMPEESDWSLVDKHIFIEEVLLRTLNKQVRNFTGSGNTPMMYPLKPVFEEILEYAEENNDRRNHASVSVGEWVQSVSSCSLTRSSNQGLGVVCNKEGGFSEDDFVVEFLGEVLIFQSICSSCCFLCLRGAEKGDVKSIASVKEEFILRGNGLRNKTASVLCKRTIMIQPEFYNIYLERPKGDADGYDLVVVDAMHKANYASRICHSCRPNCEAKVTAVDGQYQIGIYSVRPIAYGEEITFDYNSVTESKEEYEASVCLCGNQVCRGSYLNLTGEGAFQKVLKEHHGLLDRHCLLLEACELNSVSEEDYIDLGKAGLGSCLLGGLPDWLIAYTARLVRFINFERTKLPSEIFRHNTEEKRRYFAEIHLEVEKSDAEIQAEGVYNQRLQNLALTIDKCMAPHMEDVTLRDLKAKIHAHDPSGYDDTEMKLRKSLLWLRDEEYEKVTSPPVYITPLDLGPKYADKLGSGVHEYYKTYSETYCLGQLMFWHNQNAEPDTTLAKASRGCLSLPDVGSFYAKSKSHHEKQAQRPWPKDRIWSFKSSTKVVGSPMLDAVLHKATIDKEMVHWLKHRPPIYQAMWDS
ncbi:Histone-lysine N-methyltransferase ATXR3 [Sesamum angolense]|uniref:Histone-lysine N-methyltransferase ATXR3 n=1 Tax=Sesamum angolense TaxID=2727404 RepID=A0AAE1T4F5_9LAMI|nr:Histone-lysine N-methyltransferase ATXR3 [Sesamum angolense]